MIYLALLLIALSACGEAPIGPSSPYERIETFAGTGDAGKGPEEPTLRQALFYLPQDLTYGPDGRLYILDWNNHRVRVVTDGRISTLIGTGELGDAPAGRAREIGLNHPTHISFDPLRTPDTLGLAQFDNPALRLCHRLYRADLRHRRAHCTAATEGPPARGD